MSGEKRSPRFQYFLVCISKRLLKWCLTTAQNFSFWYKFTNICNFLLLRWFLFALIQKPVRLCFAVVVLELSLDKATCMSLWGEKEMVQRESFAGEGSGKEKASLWRAVTGFPSGSKRHQVTLFNPGSELSQAQNLQVCSK